VERHDSHTLQHYYLTAQGQQLSLGSLFIAISIECLGSTRAAGNVPNFSGPIPSLAFFCTVSRMRNILPDLTLA
jgi:hypothetical protein